MNATLSDPFQAGRRPAVRPQQLVEHWITTLLHSCGALPLYRLIDIARTLSIDAEELMRAALRMQADGVLHYDYASELVSLRPLVRPSWWSRWIAPLFARHPGPCALLVAVPLTLAAIRIFA